MLYHCFWYDIFILTLLDDGTAAAWDIASTLPLSTILESPLPEGTVSSACFSLDGCQTIIYGCVSGSICAYRNGQLIFTKQTKYADIGLLASKRPDGVWIRAEECDGLEWVGFTGNVVDHLFVGEIGSLVCKSIDRQKAVFISHKQKGVLLVNCHTMREIYQFKDAFVNSSSIGQFSNSKDLLAVTRSDEMIMIWKIDTRSRYSLLKSQAAKLGEIKSLAFTTDEAFLLCGYQSTGRGFISKANAQTGQWIQILATGPDCPLFHLSIFSHQGEEKFYR